MIKSKKNNNLTQKRDDDKDDTAHQQSNRYVSKPMLYSSIIQTESNLRKISLIHLESKANSIKAGVSKVNFPLTGNVYNYDNMVDIDLNSNLSSMPKPRPRESHSTRKPEPKLSDYYRPSFNNVQRIQMNSTKTIPELTVQYDGMAVSRLLNEIDDLIFRV